MLNTLKIYMPSITFKTHSTLLYVFMCSFVFSLTFAVPVSYAQEDRKKESPWFIVPTLSSDPKLGTSVGLLAGYLYQFDKLSTPSMFAAKTSYSKTDSTTSAAFGQMFFDENQQKLMLGHAEGRIQNDYNDFLGSGISAQTTDKLKASFLRYSHEVSDNWYLGAQYISTNYTIGAEDILKLVLDLIGLTGFNSKGIGIVAEYDTRDNERNAKKGNYFQFHNIAYRESLGGDVSFDVYNLSYSQYISHGSGHVFAWQTKGRWTEDAPIGGYSSIELRGYVRGNYLAPHYTHVQAEERLTLNSKWGLSFFAGAGCLYEELSDCDDSGNMYLSAGLGVIYTLKEKAGLVMRVEIAKGEADEYVGYLKMGNPF